MRRTKHGLWGTPEYRTWQMMKDRCLNKNGKRYADWGGRGITVASEWVNDFQAFLAHIGRRPSPRYSIDRIDNNVGYMPGNVRWALRLQQMRNTRRSRIVTVNGKTQCISAWCEELGIEPDAVWSRIKKGWSEERALLTPRCAPKRDSHGRFA